jgi:hypothetical protein
MADNAPMQRQFGIRSSEFGVSAAFIPNSEFRTPNFHVACVLSLVTALLFGGVVSAAPVESTERAMEQLSQAIAAYKQAAAPSAGYDVVFRRDPMQPLVDAQGRPVTFSGLHGGLSVQGIIWSDERPLAVIDDELFAQGDAVGPYTILQVRQDGVITQRGDEYLFVPLDRGLETQHEQRINPLSLMALPEETPVPYAPKRRPVMFESGNASVVPNASSPITVNVQPAGNAATSQ